MRIREKQGYDAISRAFYSTFGFDPIVTERLSMLTEKEVERCLRSIAQDISFYDRARDNGSFSASSPVFHGQRFEQATKLAQHFGYTTRPLEEYLKEVDGIIPSPLKFPPKELLSDSIFDQ